MTSLRIQFRNQSLGKENDIGIRLSDDTIQIETSIDIEDWLTAACKRQQEDTHGELEIADILNHGSQSIRCTSRPRYRSYPVEFGP